MPKHYRPAGKKKEGNAARYITKSQAVKYLQVSLSLFRKLCILKGIFPREPKKKVKGNHHTYYHTKDILFLKHEPLLEKFREMRAYEKKIKKAVSKKNRDLAERLLTRKPTYTLDMLIRERSPKFIDALRDLDDCLSMVHLFAALPAVEREKIPVNRVHNCRRLSHEWQAYVSRIHKLRKTFISVKGIYYQAEIDGQKITWLTPHALQQVLPADVDYNIMLTFLEFYETLLAFVNFKLYHSINVKYPPILDSRLEALAADLYALSRFFDSRASMTESKATSTSESDGSKDLGEGTNYDESELRLAQLQQQLPSNEPGALMHLVQNAAESDEDDSETRKCKALLKDVKFFLSREVPRESLLFVIPAFGGIVSWDGEGAPFKETDQSITHQIVDRPTQGHKFLSREYVQPQWIYDCINARILLPVDEYVVGRIPPPHLSPFVDNEAEGYVPEYAETIKRLQAAARQEVLPMPGVGKEDLDDPQNLLVEGVIDRAEAIEAAEKKRKMSILQKQYHDELKKELGSTQISAASAGNKDTGGDSLPDISQIFKDADSMSDILMPRKRRKLLDAMKRGKEKKQTNVDRLKQRNRMIKEGKISEKKNV
uniref:Pescadillo homolog n=1 Tax=Nicotiana benthamiana TaxID=4100 RepID=M4NBP4_NICBE|nr:pescadillo [Nicotiana benthamiana]